MTPIWTLSILAGTIWIDALGNSRARSTSHQDRIGDQHGQSRREKEGKKQSEELSFGQADEQPRCQGIALQGFMREEKTVLRALVCCAVVSAHSRAAQPWQRLRSEAESSQALMHAPGWATSRRGLGRGRSRSTPCRRSSRWPRTAPPAPSPPSAPSPPPGTASRTRTRAPLPLGPRRRVAPPGTRGPAPAAVGRRERVSSRRTNRSGSGHSSS